MLSQIYSVAFLGIQAKLIEIQTQFSPGLPSFSIVGLADKAVAESRERIRACLHGMGLDLPPIRITVNLTPADIQKVGSHYDLPIALSILGAMGILKIDDLKMCLALGEITLDGRILKVNGTLPAAILASSLNLKLICPKECGGEAVWAGNIDVKAAHCIKELIRCLKHEIDLDYPQALIQKDDNDFLNMNDIKGQSFAKRGLEIAAAGAHNVLMIGPPGSGKSMLAARMPGIMPQLSAKEALDVTIIHSLAGTLQDSQLIKIRPFRDPHHSASLPALVGGGQKGKPGEISLAHCGILFLDELPEFSKQCLESLRQPMENGNITIARVQAHYTYPANFQCIAAMNPCRCGHFGNIKKQCIKAPRCFDDYMQKISGPMLDRFDMVFNVNALTSDQMQEQGIEECSDIIKQRVIKARLIQDNRNGESITNSRINGKKLENLFILSKEAKELLKQAIDRYTLSARAYFRLIKVSRTIADLDNQEEIKDIHVLESLNYRFK